MRIPFALNLIPWVGGALLGCGQPETDSTSVTSLHNSFEGWSRTLGGPGNDFGYAVAAEPEGGVVIAGGYSEQMNLGHVRLTSHGGTDVFVARYRADGRPLWVRSFGGEGEDAGYALATDRSGSVFLAGLFDGAVDFGGGTLTSSGGSSLFVLELNPAGRHVWSVALRDATVAELPAIAVDERGHVVVTGTGTLADGQHGVFVIAYGAHGKQLWMSTATLAADGASYSVATDAHGDVYIAGFFDGEIDFPGTRLSSNAAAVFVAKYRHDGTFLFARSFGGTGMELGGAVAVTRSGHAIVAGSFMGSMDFGDAPLQSVGGFDVFLAQLDSRGNPIWARRYGGAASEMCRTVATDGAANIWLTGTFMSGNADLGSGSLAKTGLIDVFAAEYDRHGDPTWSRALGGTQLTAVYDLAARDAGAAYVSGAFTGTADFGSGSETAEQTDVFLVKLVP